MSTPSESHHYYSSHTHTVTSQEICNLACNSPVVILIKFGVSESTSIDIQLYWYTTSFGAANRIVSHPCLPSTRLTTSQEAEVPAQLNKPRPNKYGEKVSLTDLFHSSLPTSCTIPFYQIISLFSVNFRISHSKHVYYCRHTRNPRRNF